MKLLTQANTKTLKGESAGYLTGILHLAPSDVSGINVCPHASPGCKAVCLNTAGRGRFARVQSARIRKTRELFHNPFAFRAQLTRDIEALERKALRFGLKPCVRLNGTSDLPWERMPAFSSLFAQFPHVQFYDYTKDRARAIRSKSPAWPVNYHLTYSQSERDTPLDIGYMLLNLVSVALVTTDPADCNINGDLHDLRFLDPPGSRIALTPKGTAKHDTTGFVRFKKAA